MIECSPDQVKEALMTRLKDPSDEKLAEVIVGYLNTIDHALPGLMKALVGIYPTVKYKKGDMVWVKFGHLPSWKVDKRETKKMPHWKEGASYDKEGLLLCQIEDVNLYHSSPYVLSFTFMDSGAIKQVTYQALEYVIAYKEESFLDLLDALSEQTPIIPADDQPF